MEDGFSRSGAACAIEADHEADHDFARVWRGRWRGRGPARTRLGWELLDHELLHRAAQLEHLPDADLEVLDEQAVGLSDRFRIHPKHERYIHGLAEAARQAALRGNVILVGRGTHRLVGGSSDALNLRLVAPRDWRTRRMAAIEGLEPEVVAARCLEVDRARERFTKYFFGPTRVIAVSDTIWWSTRVVCRWMRSSPWWRGLVRDDSTSNAVPGTAGGRILTLARELGAGDTGFAPTLADRLGLRCYDRALLEQEAVRLGVLEIEAEKIDENPAGIFERFRPGSIHRRYFEVLGQLMNELAVRGDVLLVGRGGSCFLCDHPGAFHVRLVAPMAIRCGG